MVDSIADRQASGDLERLVPDLPGILFDPVAHADRSLVELLPHDRWLMPEPGIPGSGTRAVNTSGHDIGRLAAHDRCPTIESRFEAGSQEVWQRESTDPPFPKWQGTLDYLIQGKLRFSSGYKLQRRWGLAEACVFTLECAGAPLVAMSLMANAGLASFATGWLMVVLAVALLVHHLGHPRRAWKAVLNVRHSWISRGTLALGAFVVLGVLYLATWSWGEPEPTGRADAVLRWVFAGGALFIGLYPGLVLSATSAIAFWNSGLLPILSLLQGTTSAASLLVAFGAGAATLAGVPLTGLLLWLLAAHALVLALYLASMLRRGAAASESARHLLRDHRSLFLVAACGLGILVPFVLTVTVAFGGRQGGALLLASIAIARLAGDLALRQSFLKVGMFERVI